MPTHSLKQITPPAVEPVTLAEVKHHLGLPPELVEDDLYLMGLVSASRRMAEVRTGRAIMGSRWRAAIGRTIVSRCGGGCGSRYHDDLPLGLERLPKGPVLYGPEYPIEVFQEDEVGDLQPLPVGEFHVHRLYDAVSVRSGWGRGMWVEWWAGAETAAEVEPTLKAAISMMVTILYSNRGDGSEGETATAWDAVSALCMSEWDGRIYR
jgi:hypothetical protein